MFSPASSEMSPLCWGTMMVSSSTASRRHRGRRTGEPLIGRTCALVLNLWLLFALSMCACQGANLAVGALKCEYRPNPLGIDTPLPRLSWVLESNVRGQTQTAYQVLVATTSEGLSRGQGDLWDSGKVSSSRSVHLVYGGKPLRPGQRVYWKVRAWDGGDQPSAYSRPAWWEMALLAPEDWQAQWITRKSTGPIPAAQAFDDHPAPLFRKEFALDKKIVRARAYVSGLGYYVLRLNGQRVGDHVLDPGWTTYSKRVLYSTYDVTPQLKRGRNAVGITLGNGWFNPLPLGMWGRLKPGDALTTGEP